MSVQNRKRAKAAVRNRRAAFYDLDGTLAELNLVHSVLFVLTNLGSWSDRVAYVSSFAARLPRLYAAERRDRHLLNVVMFGALRGISRDRLVMLGEEYCERVLWGGLYERAVELLQANREAGLEPVLVTGSPDFMVAPLARRLGAASFAANRLVFRGGIATGRLCEPVMAGAEKAHWLARFADANRLELADCWGYADSYYDLPFLSAVGHPVAVNPDRRLDAVARARRWPVMHFGRRGESAAADGLSGWLLSRLGGILDGASGSQA